jgi:hypothetical protein
MLTTDRFRLDARVARRAGSDRDGGRASAGGHAAAGDRGVINGPHDKGRPQDKDPQEKDPQDKGPAR